ncbi:Acetyl-CoA synthetase-like protein [Mycena kentingensis (nom. inval.)]|nr:Acetyl-CoA synthetase-like protein [Mycena kentingensis (nom. inval.)]
MNAGRRVVFPACTTVVMADSDIDLNLPFPDNILRIARRRADVPLGSLVSDPAVGAGPEPEISDLTWRTVIQHVRKQAEELLRVGPPPRRAGNPQPVVVGLLIRNGYNYFVTLTAMMMLRWTPLLLSPRNSTEGTLYLVRTAGVKHLIVDSTLAALGANVKALNPGMELVQLDEVDWAKESSQGTGTEIWPDHGTESPQELSDEANLGLLAFFHTSGSTGNPKLIPWRHRWLSLWCIQQERQKTPKRGTSYIQMPTFHSSGSLLAYIMILGRGSWWHFLDSRQPPTATSVLRNLAIVGVRAAERESPLEVVMPPSIMEAIVDGDKEHLQDNLKVLRMTSMVMTGGALLRKDVGDFLRRESVPIQTIVGMTELGTIGMIELEEDWEYMKLNDMYKFTFKGEEGPGGQQEMIVLPHENAPCVINHKDPEGFATGDLWAPHPTKPGLWKIIGRAGDTTVLSNGEKTDNKQLETLLCVSPLIEHAAVFGTGRFLNGVIISPPPSYTLSAADEYLDAVWPHISSAVNPAVPQHSRLIRPLVLAVDPARPFVITDKGSLDRKRTLAKYEQDINAAYVRVEHGAYEEVPIPEGGFAGGDVEGVTKYVQAVVEHILLPAAPIPLEQDLFYAGLESLMAMRVRTGVVAALRKAGAAVEVPRNIAYLRPTQAALVAFILDALESGDGSAAKHTDAETKVAEAIARHTANFPVHQPGSDASVSKVQGDVYAVTGTTGSLGSFFVAMLLRQPQVRKVYLLNRKSAGKTAQQRHEAAFRDRGLDGVALADAVDAKRAVYVDIALGEPKLGVSDAVYNELRKEVTHIVHCAWMVNFNLILESFEEQLTGLRGLLDLALSSTRSAPASVTVISSVGTVGRWKDGPVPEEQLGFEFCLDQGYAHSKYVAEKMLEKAVAERPGISCTVIRSGQIAGAEGTGAWPKNEFIPTLIRSSKDLRLVPGGLQDVRWLPVNVAADALYAQIRAATLTAPHLTFYNLENSVTLPWADIAEVLSKQFAAPIVPANEWLQRVRERTELHANKLLSFFEEYVEAEAFPVLSVEKGQAASGGLLQFGVSRELIELYAGNITPNRRLNPDADMHRALQIPEIVLQIISQFYTWDRRWLLAVALTCRFFSNPALDALWRSPSFNTLLYIMKLFPSDLLTLTETPNRVKVTLLRPVMTADWETPSRYRSRVRCYYFGVAESTRYLDILRLLAVWLPDSVLFPRLEELYWTPDAERDQTQDIAFLRLFFSPRLRELSLASQATLALSALPTITYLGSPLRRVRIGDRMALDPFAPKRAAISTFVRSLDRVESLQVPAIDFDAFAHLAGLPGLERLTVLQFNASTVPEDYVLPSTPAPFPKLEYLSISEVDVATAIRVLGIVAKTPLEELAFQVAAYTTTADIDVLFAEFPTLLPPSLTRLTVKVHEAADVELLVAADGWKVSRAALVRLTGLPRLTSLTLESIRGYIGLDNPTLLSLATALPDLETLQLHQLIPPAPESAPEITLSVLAPLAKACPGLSALGLTLSLPAGAGSFPSLRPSANNATRLQQGLLDLNTGFTRIQPAARVPTAHFLSGLFPALARPDGGISSSWDVMEDADMNEEEDEQSVMCARWREVAELVPQLEDVRAEERMWAKVERGEVPAADAEASERWGGGGDCLYVLNWEQKCKKHLPQPQKYHN